MTIGTRIIGATVLAAVAHCAVGQNLLDNSSFDLDTSSWTSPLGVWSNLENHGGSASGSESGSLQMTTNSFTATSQCVPVAPSTTYVLHAWIELDPLREEHPCTVANANLEIDWYSDAACKQTELSNVQIQARHPIPFGWYDATLISTSPQVAQGASVHLNDFCSTQDGTSLFYFDDVTLMPDAVFTDDFEVHALKGDPGQPQ